MQPTHIYTGPTTRDGLPHNTPCRLLRKAAGAGGRIIETDPIEGVTTWLVVKDQVRSITPITPRERAADQT